MRYARWRRFDVLRTATWFSATLLSCRRAWVANSDADAEPTSTAKDKSKPFPCMNSPCGCRDADQCWRHCCCHSLAERLAWVRENHVEPPDEVIAEAKAEGIDWQSVSQRRLLRGRR